MADEKHPAHPQQALVSLPAEISIGNSAQIRRMLAAAARPGITTVVADLTDTRFCDYEGAFSLAQAHRDLAAGHHVELRLAQPSARIRFMLRGLALDALVRMYPSLDAALSPGPAPTSLPRPAPAGATAPADSPAAGE